MRKVVIAVLFFCVVSHQQSFCTRGPKHHLSRRNGQYVREQRQNKELKQALHQHIMVFKGQRQKKNLR